MDNFNYKKFIYEGSLTKNDDTKENLNENAPGYNTRKFGESLPTLESVKAAYEAKQDSKQEDLVALVRELDPNEYEVYAFDAEVDPEDADQMMDWIYSLTDSEVEVEIKKLEGVNEDKLVAIKEDLKETLDDDVWDKIDIIRNAVNDDEYVISSLIKAMSTDDANLYLDAIMRDHNFEDGSLDHLDVVSSKFSEPLAEGVWKIGNPDDVNKFIKHTTEMKNDYWNVVGSDEVMDGLDQAIKGAEKLLHTAKNPLRGGGSYNKKKQ